MLVIKCTHTHARLAYTRLLSLKKCRRFQLRHVVIFGANELCNLLFEAHNLVLFMAALYKSFVTGSIPLPLWFNTRDL